MADGLGTTTACAVVIMGAVNAGCIFTPAEDSCVVDTDEISVQAIVVDNGTDIRAEIDFEQGDRQGFPSPLRLCDEDVLTINGVEPTRTRKTSAVVYGATFEYGETDAQLTFVFDRTDRDEVVNIVATLPPAFEILAPEEAEMVARGLDTEVRWDPPNPGAEIRIDLEEEIGAGICLRTTTAGDYKQQGVSVADEGTHVIAAGAIEGDAGTECEALFKLVRTAIGEYPGALEGGGRVEARVERSVPFVSTP